VRAGPTSRLRIYSFEDRKYSTILTVR
jgi:hypothetical protein